MMNLNVLKTYVRGLEYFDFIEKTAEEASVATDGRVDPSEFNKGPGLYRILSGSRGFIDEVEKVEEFSIPTIEELVKSFEDDDDDEEAREYIEEFYMVVEDENNEGVLQFSYTEEEYDIFVKVA